MGQPASGLFQGDPNEPNNSLASATEISLPYFAEDLSISPSGDLDFFAFTLEERGFLEVDIDAESRGSFLDAVLFILDESGNEVTSNDDDDGLDPAVRVSLNPGRYIVLIRGFLNVSSGTYDLSIFAQDAGECVDSEISQGESESWSLGEIEPGSSIQLMLEGPSDTDFDLFLYEVISNNPTFTAVVRRGVSLSSRENLRFRVSGDSAREYLVTVSAFEGSGKYALCRSIATGN
jgi:hypothetical protein